MKKDNRINLSPALRRFKFFFDLLKKTTDNYIFFADLQENIIVVSPNLVNDFALPSEIMTNFNEYWQELIHPEERAQVKAALRAVTVKCTVFEHSMEYRVKNRKGEYVWLRCRGRVGTDREGNPNIFTGFMFRMAQRNRADEVTGLLNKYQFEHAVKMALAQ